MLPFLLVLALGTAQAQAPARPWEPTVGMSGKDVVWVPTPAETVEKMLDLAKVTPRDVVMDLGSGDGRMVIAAARRGARAIGVEFNPDMVEHARRRAQEAGVSERATFLQGDMYEADISKATVLALFLLPNNLEKLVDKFLALPPGSRIVLNTFYIPGWEPDEETRVEGECTTWCTVILHHVPARAGGVWRMGNGELTLTQEFQQLTGKLVTGDRVETVEGRLLGEQIVLKIGGVEHTGRVSGSQMQGTRGGSRAAWSAARIER
jgi:SAM-dependent methyltransferase